MSSTIAKVLPEGNPGSRSAQPIRVGILGAARIAPSAMIAPAAMRADISVDRVAARDAARARAFAEKHGIQASPDYAALIQRDDIDLVYVALPPSCHAEWTIRALEAGKAVLCEKPFAATSDEARDMVAAAERTGGLLIEAMHYRFHPVMNRVIETVRSGVLGQITQATAVFEGNVPHPDTLWRDDLGSGALTDLGCYPIHALRTLFGEPEVRRARIETRLGAISRVEAELEFPGRINGGVVCAMRLPDEGDGREWWLRVTGARGTIEVSNYIAPHLFGCDVRTTIDGVETSYDVPAITTYAAQLDHVVALMSGRADALTGGEDAIANMRTIDAIRAAAGIARWSAAGIPA